MNVRAATRLLGYWIAAWMLAAGAGAAWAADLSDDQITVEPPQSAWQFRFTPYAWLLFLDGEQTIKGRTADVDTNIFEIIRESDSLVGWMSYLEARRGPLALYADIYYGKLTLSGGGDVTIKPNNFVSATIAADANIEYEFAVVELGGAYEVSRWNRGGAMDAADFGAYTALDLIAGGRYWYQKAELDLALASQLNIAGITINGNRAIAGSGGVDWIDPLLGARLRHHMAPGEEIILRGDVGGFGVASDFSWQLIGAYSWVFSDWRGIDWAGVVGYRALYVDYSEGKGANKFQYDILTHGPILGLSMRF